MKQMKPVKSMAKFLLMFIATLFICSGCTANNPEPNPDGTSSGNGQTESQAKSEIEMKRVGEEHYGFWDIPEDWVAFRDPAAAEEDTMIQYSDFMDSNIITVRYFTDLDITPDVLLNRQGTYLESIGAENIIGATVKLNGIDALQLYCVLPDGTVMIAWAFESGDGYLHSIIAEGPAITIAETVGYLESSYTLEK